MFGYTILIIKEKENVVDVKRSRFGHLFGNIKTFMKVGYEFTPTNIL